MAKLVSIRDAPLINISSSNRRQMALMYKGVELYDIEKRQHFECNFRALHRGFACVISDFLQLLSIFFHLKIHILIEVSQNITHF